MEPVDVKKTTQYWLESADYDLETAKSLISVKRFPHALFFGHLAIEKLLKAVYVTQNKEHAPYTHSLTMLAENSKLSVPFEILTKLKQINEYNIAGRYPEEKDNLYKKATPEFTSAKFSEIKEVYEWFHQKL